jgi:multiple antibiotic resistance protein
MADTVAVFIRAVMLALVTLLPVINPPGSAPIFLSMTPGAPDSLRTALAGRVARHSFALLVGAMLAGSYVLIFFGLSLPVVKIAGGLLVMATAWHLIRAEQSPDATIPAAPPVPSADQPIGGHAFYPLTFPITIGPGSISVAITLGAGFHVDDVAEVSRLVGALIGVVVVAFTIYFCYRFAGRLLSTLGRTGTVVLIRLSAFVLLSVGVQILCDGIGERFGAAMAARR